MSFGNKETEFSEKPPVLMGKKNLHNNNNNNRKLNTLIRYITVTEIFLKNANCETTHLFRRVLSMCFKK